MYDVVSMNALSVGEWRALVSRASRLATQASATFAEDSSAQMAGLSNNLRDEFIALTGTDSIGVRFPVKSAAGQRLLGVVGQSLPGRGSGLYSWDLRDAGGVLLAVRDLSDIFSHQRLHALFPAGAVMGEIDVL
jgi:hypothetical protein